MEARIAPFRGDPLASGEQSEPAALTDDAPLFVFSDPQGLPIAFPTQEAAEANAPGATFRQTTFGALRRETPEALLHSPTQFYRLTDLA